MSWFWQGMARMDVVVLREVQMQVKVQIGVQIGMRMGAVFSDRMSQICMYTGRYANVSQATVCYRTRIFYCLRKNVSNSRPQIQHDYP